LLDGFESIGDVDKQFSIVVLKIKRFSTRFFKKFEFSSLESREEG
jgi:hypothetical protein